MIIKKSFEIDAPQDKVWQFVSSPEKVGMCFPGCQEVIALGDDRYKAEIKVKIGPIKTVFNVDFEETEKRPNEFSAYISRGEEGNRASRLKADSTLTLSPVNAHRTQVDYTSKLSIVGRFGKFGAGMMKKKADSMGDEFVQALRTHIEGPPLDAATEPVRAEEAGFSRRQKLLLVALAVTLTYVVFYLFAH